MVEVVWSLGGNWNVVDAEGAEWPPDYFRDIWVDRWPADRHVTVVALDPSVGKMNKATATRQGDYSAFVAVAKGHDGKYYVDANIERRPTTQIVEDGIEFLNYIRPDAFGIENVGFQELLCEQFLPQLERAKMNGIWPIHGDGDNRIPKKVVRIRSLTPLLANGRIKLRRSPGCSLLLEQMMAFPLHKHDDGPDALEMAIRLAETLLSGGGAAEPEPELLIA